MTRMSLWAASLEILHQPFYQLVVLLPFLDCDQRKVLLDYTRIRTPFQESMPSTEPRLTRFERRNMKALTKTIYFHTPRLNNQVTTLLAITKSMHQYMDPLGAAVFSEIIRCSPFNPDIEESMKAEVGKALEKEITAAIEVHHPIQLDYTPILSSRESDRYVRMSPYHGLDPDVSRSIHRSLIRQAKTISKRIILPRLSSKLPGKRTQIICQSLGYNTPQSCNSCR
jgi:hypothetical protein